MSGQNVVSEALRRTIFEYRLAGKSLAEESGLSERQISQFKNGHTDMLSSSLLKLVEAMPQDARSYFLENAFGVRSGNS